MKRDKIYLSGPVSSIGLDEARRRFAKAEADRSNSHEEFLYPKDVALFFCDICDLFDLLTTLDDIACDNSGE